MVVTERLDLRPVTADDLDAWAALLADPEVTRLLHFPEPHSREQSADLSGPGSGSAPKRCARTCARRRTGSARRRVPRRSRSRFGKD
jgi:GNAT acetyltransferase-like protein